jgi:hypothetical protein
MKGVPVFSTNIKDLLPRVINLKNSNGEYKLELTDCQMVPPKIQVVYHQDTDSTNGEPDYFCMDIHIVNEDGKYCLNIDMTYGDAMMFEFRVVPPNDVDVYHYNGYDSKFDPEYEFSLTDESIGDLIDLIHQFDFGFSLTRDKFNFLDGRKDSFKFEKISYPNRIADFKTFNRLN